MGEPVLRSVIARSKDPDVRFHQDRYEDKTAALELRIQSREWLQARGYKRRCLCRFTKP